MAKKLYIGVGGAWRNMKAGGIGVGGVYRTVKGGWIGVGGAWRQFFQNFVVVNPLPGGSSTHLVVEPQAATAGWRFSPDGTVHRRAGGNYFYSHNWGNPTTPGAGNSLYIRAILNSGSGVQGDALSSPLLLSVAREWRCVRNPPPGIATLNIDVQIAADAGFTNIIASTGVTKYTASAQVESNA